jgi:predicted CXXCH cytochrome family protein
MAVCVADQPVSEPLISQRDDWGSDHVGQEFPVYMTGDECLFCHRGIGPTWNQNPHQNTFQPADPTQAAIQALSQTDQAAAGEVSFLLGDQRQTRYLRRSENYGKLDLLSAKYLPAPADQESADHQRGELIDTEAIHWNRELFADRCAGCHTTAVDTETRTFSSTSLDCVTCHGLVELEHTEDISQVFLSTTSQEPRQVTSICGQCHLRGGKSISSGLPYPNTFVAGDNLFRDFKVDLTDQAITNLPISQQHIYLNARDIVSAEESSVSCVSCHEVHGSSGSEKHQSLAFAAICFSCHQRDGDRSELSAEYQRQRDQRPHNQTCDY